MAIASSDKLVVVKAFAPSNPLPLDAREIYDSLAAAQEYAKSSAIAYAGQTIKVVDGNSVTVYTLVPSSVEGTNYDLSFVGGGAGSGVQGIGTSTVAGNIKVTTADGTSTASTDVPVVGALVNPVVDEDAHTLTLTKLGATAEQNSQVVIPLGGAAPDKIISAVEQGTDGLTIKVTSFDTETEASTTETVKIFGAVTDTIIDNTGGYMQVQTAAKDGTTSVSKKYIAGLVHGANYNSDTKVLSIPITTGVASEVDSELSKMDIVSVDLKGVVAGAYIGVATTDDTTTSSAKHTFTYKDADGADQTKDIFEGGVRKVEAGTSADKIKITTASALTGALTASEILVGAGNVKNPTYDAETRKITLPTLQTDGTTNDLVINLGKDMVVKNGHYDTDTQEIVLVLTDDTEVKIAAADLVDVYTGGQTDTITVSVSDDNVITATVRVATKTGNLLKVDTENGGLYVVEDDFTATKKLITDGDATTLQSANDYADEKVGAEATARETAINTAKEALEAADATNLQAAKEDAQAKADAALAAAKEDATAKDTALETSLKAYADKVASANGTTWVDFGA